MFGCARIRCDERVRLLLERARRAIHRAEEPRLEAADRIDALVEEALLVAARVLVDRGDPVLVDDDLRAAIGGREHGLAEHVAGLVVAPQERADLDRLLRVANALEDRLERDVARAEHAQRPPSTGVETACSGAGRPTGLHLPHAARPPAAKRSGDGSRTAGHLDPLRLTQPEPIGQLAAICRRGAADRGTTTVAHALGPLRPQRECFGSCRDPRTCDWREGCSCAPAVCDLEL